MHTRCAAAVSSDRSPACKTRCKTQGWDQCCWLSSTGLPVHCLAAMRRAGGRGGGNTTLRRAGIRPSYKRRYYSETALRHGGAAGAAPAAEVRTRRSGYIYAPSAALPSPRCHPILDVLRCRRQGLQAAAQAWAAGGSGGSGAAAALAALAAMLQQPTAAASLHTCRAASSAAWEGGPSAPPAVPGSGGGSGGQPQIRNVQASRLHSLLLAACWRAAAT